jgi:flavin-dependent dehydrogenase
MNVNIIGGGTAGLLLARRLAEKGVLSVVLDQKEDLGRPVRASGIFSMNGLESLGIPGKELASNVLYGARIHSAKRSTEIISDTPKAYVIDRYRLNQYLKAQCKEVGVEFRLGERVDQEALDGMAMEGIVVGADGFNSVVGRHFGFKGTGRCILTYRAEYRASAEDPGVVDLFFDNSVTPGFFGWIAHESESTAEVGIGVESGMGNSRAVFERFCRLGYVREFIEGAEPIGHGASVIPIGVRRTFADDKNRALLVGDAAGQVKATTGGGVIFGGGGAIMAADTIVKYLRGVGALSDYEREWRNRFGLDIAMHSFIRKVYASASPALMDIIISSSKTLGVSTFLSRHGDMDRPTVTVKRMFAR